MLSRTCGCCAQDESTVSASLGGHSRERDLPQQHQLLSPSGSSDTGKGRDAAAGVGPGWPGGGCSPAGHSLCHDPFPSTKYGQYLLEPLFGSDTSRGRLGTTALRPPMPTHLALVTAQGNASHAPEGTQAEIVVKGCTI